MASKKKKLVDTTLCPLCEMRTAKIGKIGEPQICVECYNSPKQKLVRAKLLPSWRHEDGEGKRKPSRRKARYPRSHYKAKFTQTVRPGFCCRCITNKVYALQYCYTCWKEFEQLKLVTLNRLAPPNVRRRIKAERNPTSMLYAVLYPHR